uniref:VDE lipocalin domain-containing protein n=1 Tax=Corethron hystrix TaxID=216773 RepID=A0A7S1BM86_9STRA|mmetsp:Transcript_31807/g.73131  ORF Transcript_31807/g.73131 Transcript_31807/m.73131 type:complete len:560 (+) Transcript_31807:225-1904(+)
MVLQVTVSRKRTASKMATIGTILCSANTEAYMGTSQLNSIGGASSRCCSSRRVSPRAASPINADCPTSDGIMNSPLQFLSRVAASTAAAAALFMGTAVASPLPSFGEDELSAMYGGKGFDSSLVDQNCLVDKCSLQAKACLADDPECRKGLTCTAKCMGDNSCITGCFARYGSEKLDGLLKCTIEDNNCIKVAILPGGADLRGEEPKPPAPTVGKGRGFEVASMEGSWYKVLGFNPNYDCYACQKNTFAAVTNEKNDVQKNVGWMSGNNQDSKLAVDVTFSMPRYLPDGSPLPPSMKVEDVTLLGSNGLPSGSTSVAYNQFNLHETMVFDNYADTKSSFSTLSLGSKDENGNQKSYARTAHSEGQMFGLNFWENWYVIGQNEPGQPEFKFVYYNGKTRQNTYEGAFVYSRTKEMDEQSLKKIYSIASDAGMNPDNFCKIRNGCFEAEDLTPAASDTSKSMLEMLKSAEMKPPPQGSPLRAILASTRISEFLGVEPVSAEMSILSRVKADESFSKDVAPVVMPQRPWWKEVGDYLEDPHKHFQLMDSMKVTMDWPESVRD